VVTDTGCPTRRTCVWGFCARTNRIPNPTSSLVTIFLLRELCDSFHAAILNASDEDACRISTIASCLPTLRALCVLRGEKSLNHRPHPSTTPKTQGRELTQISKVKRQPSGPTPLRKIPAHHRKHKQPEHRQTQDHYHHGATLQTPSFLATPLPIPIPSFSTIYHRSHPPTVEAKLHFCHAFPAQRHFVLLPSSHY